MQPHPALEIPSSQGKPQRSGLETQLLLTPRLQSRAGETLEAAGWLRTHTRCALGLECPSSPASVAGLSAKVASSKKPSLTCPELISAENTLILPCLLIHVYICVYVFNLSHPNKI
ncbi:unnamed protein product [Rangifer tarandus platyrhynchus]|uniref:Uncharacterized protein n=1 Tax=Rangifer tarandus platyrhynchus TaxID=3082113 RepID=A0AC59ZXU8_RANTA